VTPAGGVAGPRANEESLLVLRRFSEILTHSLDTAALVRQFLHLLREVMGVNRSAIFLKPPTLTSGGTDVAAQTAWMRVACAVGLAPALSEHCVLSAESGIGACLLRTGRVLRRHTIEASDTPAQREFEMIGAEVAVPIMGRDEMVGVAVFDIRVTGLPLTNGELECIFHLLEQVGLAVANIHAHEQLVGSNQLLGEVLRELSNACVVVGPDLTVLHANKAARRAIGGAGRRSGGVHFSDLPEELGGKVYQVIKTGAALPTFRYETGNASQSVYSVSVVPIRSSESAAGASGNAALLVMEDRTQAEQLQRLEVETANLRLVNNMADRLAAEIGNAIVPLSVHHQLFDQRIKEAEFRKSLSVALGDGVKRVERLASQMRFIYGNSNKKPEPIPLGELLGEADKEAKGSFASNPGTLDVNPEARKLLVNGTRGALKHALAEIILNGYQANPSAAEVSVRRLGDSQIGGANLIGIEFQNSGEGFSAEAAKRAVEPFYTTRTVGVGLGLTAAQKIVQDHGGHLEIPANQPNAHGILRVFLPSGKRGE
jgi:nitrogen fixation/metabolism regulation signal transduction histidine kinase